jgi:hypothetical protein
MSDPEAKLDARFSDPGAFKQHHFMLDARAPRWSALL